MKRQTFSVVAVVMALLMTGGSILASAPEPVLPVEGGDPPA